MTTVLKYKFVSGPVAIFTGELVLHVTLIFVVVANILRSTPQIGLTVFGCLVLLSFFRREIHYMSVVRSEEIDSYSQSKVKVSRGSLVTSESSPSAHDHRSKNREPRTLSDEKTFQRLIGRHGESLRESVSVPRGTSDDLESKDEDQTARRDTRRGGTMNGMTPGLLQSVYAAVDDDGDDDVDDDDDQYGGLEILGQRISRFCTVYLGIAKAW
jgi:hypothetical protein